MMLTLRFGAARIADEQVLDQIRVRPPRLERPSGAAKFASPGWLASDARTSMRGGFVARKNVADALALHPDK